MEEDKTPSVQSLQFGFRNDAWAAIDEARAEAAYILKTEGSGGAVSSDLRLQVDAAVAALRGYVGLADSLISADSSPPG